MIASSIKLGPLFYHRIRKFNTASHGLKHNENLYGIIY